MRILPELVFIPQKQESILRLLHDIPRFLIFFIEQLFLIFNQMFQAFKRLVGVLFIKEKSWNCVSEFLLEPCLLFKKKHVKF